MVLSEFLRWRPYALDPRERYYEPLTGVGGAPALGLAPWKEPTVLVDADYFDESLVDLLVFSSPRVRRRVLEPITVTAAETQYLTWLSGDLGLREDMLERHVPDEPF